MKKQKHERVEHAVLYRQVRGMEKGEMKTLETTLSVRQVSCFFYYLKKMYRERGLWLHRFYNGIIFIVRVE
jgi:hypothetical protein